MAIRCEICKKKFTTQSTLNRHLRKCHKIIFDTDTKKYFRCLDCDNVSYKRNIELLEHLKTSHGKVFEELEFTVATMSEFEEWKREMEKETISHYIVKNNTEKGAIYYCNRSLVASKIKRMEEKLCKKQGKRQGSCKMQFHCTSQIKLHKKTNEIKVFWQKTHYGHTPQLQHIRLPIEDKLFVASKLINGEPPTKILQTVRDSIALQPKRIDLLTLKDINNIKTSFHIENAPQSNFSQHSTDEDRQTQFNNKLQLTLTELSKVNVADYDDEVVMEMERCLSKLLNLLQMKKISTSKASHRQCEPQNIIKIRPQKKKTKINCNNERSNTEGTDDIKNILTEGNSMFISKYDFFDHNYI